MTVTLDDMRPRLYDLDHVYRVLETTEPMYPRSFSVADAGLKFRAEPGWNHGVKAKDGNEPVGVYVQVGGTEFQMTRSTLEETCLAFKFGRDLTTSCPADLLVQNMNYWYREGLLDAPKRNQNFQYLVKGDTAIAFTRQSLTPFSNLALLEQAVAGIRAKYGDVEILADYKLSHTLRQTYVRLIVPATEIIIADSGTAGDAWSLGISLKNSLTGATQTAIEGYLFRWTCTNGQIDTRASSGAWTRRKDATEAEVYSWARQAVDEALSGLQPAAWRALADLTLVSIDGSLADTLRDVFEHCRIGIHQRPKIIRILEEYDGEITMYVIMNAITQVANEPGLDPTTVDSLMRAGGELPYTGDQRCGTCHRMMHNH